jgi:hypothetical protein
VISPDIPQSQEDDSTDPMYCEARLVKINLKPEECAKIDPSSSHPMREGHLFGLHWFQVAI